MATTLPNLCWICGDPAVTREHTMNQAAIRLACGEPRPGAPYFFHNADGVNQQLQGLASKLLKPYLDLCQRCNATLTQPHDRALLDLVRWLTGQTAPLAVGNLVRPQMIYPARTRDRMLALHLYFTKKFGCLVCEGRASGKPIGLDLDAAARALRGGKACPHLYLKLGRRMIAYPCFQRSAPVAFVRQAVRGCEWRYAFRQHVVEVLYFENVVPDDPALHGAWHPRFGLRPFRILPMNKMT